MFLNSTGVAFTIGTFVVYWFAVFLAAAMIAALVLTALLSKKRFGSDDLAVDLCIVCIPCGILGGRLFAALSGQILFSQFFQFGYTGLSLFGAVFACIGGVAVYCAIKKKRLLDVLDLLLPGFLAAVAIGRWGDFVDRSAYGPAVERSWMKFFPLATFASDQSIRFAPFFYTFLLCVGLLAVYFLLFFMKKRRRGMAFTVIGAAYCFVEFFIEWVRVDRNMLLGLRFNQWMCMLGFVACALTYFLCVRDLEPEDPVSAAELETEANGGMAMNDDPDEADAATSELAQQEGAEDAPEQPAEDLEPDSAPPKDDAAPIPAENDSEEDGK